MFISVSSVAASAARQRRDIVVTTGHLKLCHNTWTVFNPCITKQHINIQFSTIVYSKHEYMGVSSPVYCLQCRIHVTIATERYIFTCWERCVYNETRQTNWTHYGPCILGVSPHQTFCHSAILLLDFQHPCLGSVIQCTINKRSIFAGFARNLRQPFSPTILKLISQKWSAYVLKNEACLAQNFHHFWAAFFPSFSLLQFPLL